MQAKTCTFGDQKAMGHAEGNFSARRRVGPLCRAALAIMANGRLFEEQVPRAGVVVERGWQFSRLHQGAIHAWITHAMGIGGGEGSSGLASDLV